MSSPVRTNRIHCIDALRGFALAGVVLVHMIEQYIAGATPEGFMEGTNGVPDYIVQGLLQFFISGKFFAIFSILFGLSFAIQMQAAEAKNKNFGLRFLWRAVLLFVIGFVHHLFYRGDILTIYAVLAPFIIPFYRVGSKWILIVSAFIFLGIPRFVSFLVFGGETVTGIHPVTDNANELVLGYFETITNGTLFDVFRTNATYGMLTKIDFQLSFFGRFYYTFGYFLLGLWLGRTGIFKDLSSFKKRINTTMLWSIAGMLVGIVLTFSVFASMPQPVDNTSWQFVLGMNFMDWVNLAMTIIILCGFLLLYQRPVWERRLLFFAPYGRMALTNYFFQSILGTFIFFGWGLGYLGQIRYSYLLLLALLVIAIQATFSKYWLKKFYYGPLEWLWRSCTYFQWQPFLKPDSPSIWANQTKKSELADDINH